ncbi:hypothetical protein ACYSNN_05955 [Peptoniphilus genitalis]
MGYVNINDVSCTSKTGYKILKDINLNVEKGECILLGQSLGSTEAWDGKLKIDESWKKIELSHSFLLRKLKADYKVERQVPRPLVFNEKVGRFKYQGLVLGKYKEEITTEFKDKEEEENAQG